MSQIRPKQIRLNNQGDLIIGDANGNGSILSIGKARQSLFVSSSSLAWEWIDTLREPISGNPVVQVTSDGTDPVNLFEIKATTGVNPPSISVIGTSANIDMLLQPKGTGELLTPTSYTANIKSPNSLVTKQYVDMAITGLDWKNSVRVATTSAGDLTGYTYNPANEPAGFVWTGVTSPFTIDGVTLNDGDRILIKNAPDSRGNGIFYYDQTNNAFVRTEDANNTPNNEVSNGLAVFVEAGTTNASTAWVLVQPYGLANLGTDNLVFTQFAGTNLYVAGSGLSLTGNVFRVNESNTIGVEANNIIVKSNGINGNVLISTGNVGQEAVWGALNLGNPNSVTGVLNVSNGGTGLSFVSAGHLLVGTGSGTLATLAPTPPSTESQIFVLATNEDGDGVVFTKLKLTHLVDASAPNPMTGDVLQWDGGEWVPVSPLSLQIDDKFVKITSNDDTAGYLNDKLVVDVSGALTKTILSAGAGERLSLRVNYDNATIIVNSNALSVGNGTSAQFLRGNGPNAPAVWISPNNLLDYEDVVYDPVEGKVRYLTRREITSWRVSAAGGQILAGIFDGINNNLEFNGGTGTRPYGLISGKTYYLQFDISYVTAQHVPVTLDPNDKFMIFDSSNGNNFTYATISHLVSALNLMSVTTSGLVVSVGGSAVTRNIVANASADRSGIEIINSDGQNGNIIVGLAIETIPSGTAKETDYVLVYDSQTDVNKRVAVSSILALNTSANYKWYGITDGITTLEPDTLQDTLTVIGSGIALTLNNATDTIEFTLNIPQLVSYTPASAGNLANLYVAVYHSALGAHYEVNLGNAIDTAIQTFYASANAVGSINETFANFFSNANVDDASVIVFFNGIALKQNGWTRSGTSLTLVDSVNGYGTEAGDVITAYYRLM